MLFDIKMNEIQSKVLGQYAKYIYVVTLYFYRKLHHCSINLYSTLIHKMVFTELVHLVFDIIVA